MYNLYNVVFKSFGVGGWIEIFRELLYYGTMNVIMCFYI